MPNWKECQLKSDRPFTVSRKRDSEAMSILFRIASRVDTKSYPEYFEQQRPEIETSRSHTSKIDQHRVGAVDREGLVHSIPALTPEYLLLSQWVLPLRYLLTLHRKVAQLRPVTDRSETSVLV